MLIKTVIYSIVCIILLSVIGRYVYQVLKNFRENEKVSMLRFFLDERAIKSFEAVAFTTILAAALIIFNLSLELLGGGYFTEFVRLGIVLFLSGSLYFMRNIALVTSRRRK